MKSSLPRSGSATVLAIVAVIALLYFGSTFFITILIASMLAIILDPFVVLITRFRAPRPVASLLICSVTALLVYLAGLAAYSQLAGMADELPSYSQRLNSLVDSATKRVNEMQKRAYELLMPAPLQTPEYSVGESRPRRKKPPTPPPSGPPPLQEVRLRQDPPPLYSYVYSYLSRYYNSLLMASFVPFLVYFMLSWRDHLRGRFVLLFEGADQISAAKSWAGVAEIARAYVIGNFLLGVILTICSSGLFYGFHLPYWPLIGALSAFVSLVPYVGLPLALVPPLVSALAIYNDLPPYFFLGISVAFFHLVALNVLYPKLVGSRVHLNPLVVTISLMFWGTLWGGIGIVLAIPITAGIKAVCDNVPSLQPYGDLMSN